MPIKFLDDAWDDYLTLQRDHKELLKRLHMIIRDIQRNPFDGIGKPERLKQNLSGYWSRRLTEEHRLVYAIEGDTLVILQCRYHY
jgi:toxin YoeB